jgi:hypothetical protein
MDNNNEISEQRLIPMKSNTAVGDELRLSPPLFEIESVVTES